MSTAASTAFFFIHRHLPDLLSENMAREYVSVANLAISCKYHASGGSCAESKWHKNCQMRPH
jgi:hypothetical protein